MLTLARQQSPGVKLSEILTSVCDPVSEPSVPDTLVSKYISVSNDGATDEISHKKVQ